MTESIYLNTVSIRSRSLQDKLTIAQKTGFSGVELTGDEIDVLTERQLFAFRSQAEELGISLGGVCTASDLFRWHYDWDAALQENLKTRFANYDLLGLQWVIFPVMSSDGTLTDTSRNFERICRLSATYHLSVGLEFIGHVSKLDRLETAYSVIKEVGAQNSGLVLDLFHFFRGGSDPTFIRYVDPNLLLVVHVDDALPLPRKKLVGYKHRVYPGHGQIDVSGLLGRIIQTDYTGPYTVELFNEDYWKMPASAVARTAYSAAQRVLRRAKEISG